MLDFRLPGFDALTRTGSRVKAASEAERYDVIIIGGGPAGTTAVVYACRKGLKTLLVTENIGGQMLWTSGIENYAGFQYITGPELVAKFDAQIHQFPLAVAEPTRAEKLEKSGDGFQVLTSDGKRYLGQTVIVAAGRSSRRLEIPGEKELTGKGVTYCAVCDAPLYVGKDVAVVGGGNSALTSLLDLAPIARTVYSIRRGDDFRGDAVLIDKVAAAANILHRAGFQPTAILGQDLVTGIEVKNTATGAGERIDVDGVFVEVGTVSNAEFAAGLLELNPAREIVVNCRTETSVPGVFAAGDATDVFEKQIIIAAGEGAKAALAAAAFLLARPG